MQGSKDQQPTKFGFIVRKRKVTSWESKFSKLNVISDKIHLQKFSHLKVQSVSVLTRRSGANEVEKSGREYSHIIGVGCH